MRRYFNWYYILGLFAVGSLAACTQAQTGNEQEQQRQALVKKIQDSLQLDSFRRAEALEAQLAEQELQQEQTFEGSANEEGMYNQPTYTNQEPVYDDQPAYDVPYVAPQETKQGWSDAAKGTAIGAGVGAGMGILIDKDKRGRGAAIGALIGGGSGYLIGRKRDRESGRVQK